MKLTKKIVTVGSSLGVLIDKIILDEMNLTKGDFVEIDVKRTD